MIALLARLFIRDSENTSLPCVRLSYGLLCGAVGVALNILLFIGKIIAGTLSASIAVTADAFNNLSDAGSSIVVMVGFRLAGHKADREHPFGHGRMEYVAGLIVSMAILVMGFELGKSSVEKILSPEPVVFSMLTVGILAASIAVKLYMFFYNRRIGKKIDSAAMRATAMDSFSDVAATSVVLLATLIGKWTGVAIDGWAGCIVAVFILYTGVSAAKETIAPLLGRAPDAAFVSRIEELVLAHPEVIGVHDLIVHDYGPGRVLISLHAEVPAKGDMIHLHDAVDNIEKELRRDLGCAAVIHMDPVETDDEETIRLRAAVEELVGQIDERLSVHDFRIVKGHTHTNLVFDLVIPYGFPMEDETVCGEVMRRVEAMDGNCYAVIEVDQSNIQ